MSVDYLREQIKKLSLEREKATFEKGLSAQENKDLRENSEYDYWVEKETNLTIKIGNLHKEIVRITEGILPKKTVKAKKKTKAIKLEKISDLPRNRWL
jgi:hypothetical protein